MARAPSRLDDAALDAAALLRRIGFFGLFVLVPVAAQVTRRASVVVAPIAIILLVIASAIDRRHRPLREGLVPPLRAPASLGAILLVGWIALSLAWTPFPIPATERFANILATLLLTLAGYLALPDRMRSANLYLLPIGVAAAAVFAIVVGLFGGTVIGDGAEADSVLERGAIVIAVLAWPAVAWLCSREHDTQALLLALLVGGALLLAPTALPIFGYGLGAVAFGLTSYRQELGTRATALALAIAVAAAPLLPVLARPIALSLFGKSAPGVQSIITWQKLVTSEPFRLVTGHGFETALRGRLVGLVPVNAPNSMLFEIWYELGVVGAFALAFVLHAIVRRVALASPPLVPGAMAAFAAAFVMSIAGQRPTIAWWLTSLALTALVFVAIQRGQFRSRRPKVTLAAGAAGSP